MNEYSFGYPTSCTQCLGFSEQKTNLQVAPYLKEGEGLRLMLIGQDPTIFRKPGRVKHVLMLDEPNGQLTRWLKSLFGEKNFQSVTLYATNLVKCSFEKPPSTTDEGGLKFLQPYFANCKEYLIEEVRKFKPECVLTLGEPAHKLFITILDNHADIPESMQGAFTGEFVRARIGDFEFDYSPCLHIKTWRVAEVYGDSVKRFKEGVAAYFQTN